jgi:ankyrin repeat protein
MRLVDVRRLGCSFATATLVAAVLAPPLGAQATLPLVEAVKQHDIHAVRTLLSQKVDVNRPLGDGSTALHWAAETDNVDIAGLLVQGGAAVGIADRHGVTPIMIASGIGSARMIGVLLKAGADPKTATLEGETALMSAARTGSVEAVRTLLEAGADPNVVERWRRQTALMWAAGEGHATAVRVLVDRGAGVQARSAGGFSPLLFAVRGGHLETVRALIEAGADVNDAAPDGTRALALAIVNAHYDVASVLLANRADPNAPDPRGSALHALAWMRNTGFAWSAPPRVATGGDTLELAEALLVAGANPNARVAWKENRFDRDIGSVKSPPNISIGRNYLSFVGATPFYIAAKGADLALMRLLAKHGADATIPTVQKITPLMAAAGLGFWDGESPGPENGVPESRSLEAVKLAIELGNDVNAVTDFGSTRLDGDPVTLLGRHPLNIATFGEDALGDMRWGGSTALHGAAVRGADSIVTYLVERGARVDAHNGLGWTPEMVAGGVFVANTRKEWPSTVALLKRMTAQVRP